MCSRPPETRTPSSTSRRTGTTNASTAPPASTFRSGRFGRSPHGEYPEYHTSADDLGFVDPDALADSFTKLVAIIDVLERDGTYRNLSPKGEPQLGRRGLYRAVGGDVDARSTEMAFLWVLNLSDGTMSLLDIARRSGLAFDAVHRAAELLEAHELLARI